MAHKLERPGILSWTARDTVLGRQIATLLQPWLLGIAHLCFLRYNVNTGSLAGVQRDRKDHSWFLMKEEQTMAELLQTLLSSAGILIVILR